MSAGNKLENENPLIYQRSRERLLTASEEDEDVTDPIDDREIFDILLLRYNLLCSVFNYGLMLKTQIVCVCALLGFHTTASNVFVDGQSIICVTVVYCYY